MLASDFFVVNYFYIQLRVAIDIAKELTIQKYFFLNYTISNFVALFDKIEWDETK